jgi:hypothetical protein
MAGAQDNYYPYVFTNPTHKTNVTNKDRAFVLGNDIQKDLIVEYEINEDKSSENTPSNLTAKTKENGSK